MLNSVCGDFFNTRNVLTADCEPELLDAALAKCREYNDLLSKTVPGSDVWRLNHAQGASVEVSAETAEILVLAQKMYEDSGGRFNIAIGSAVALWNFTNGSKSLPDRDALARAVARADCSGIRIEGRHVTPPDGVQMDLGGIAKGYIADGLGRFLRDHGVKNAYINLGGNVLTLGRHPDGTPWRVGLQLPTRDYTQRDRFWAMVDCEDASVVTCGSYERGFEKDGVWYHHILDTKTGWPAKSEVLAVTVRATQSLLADALTTPLFLLGAQEGMALARRYGVEAAFYLTGRRVVVSEGMHLSLARE